MRVLFQYPNGRLAFLVPSPKWKGTMEELAAKDLPVGVTEYSIVPDDAIPTDRSFRNAWDYDHAGKRVRVNFERAKEITKERLRKEREPILKELDVKFMKALGAGEYPQPIVSEKARLCDITKLVDQCKSLQELKDLSCNGTV